MHYIYDGRTFHEAACDELREEGGLRVTGTCSWLGGFGGRNVLEVVFHRNGLRQASLVFFGGR